MGLPVPTSIVGSTNAIAQQMWTLATDVGQKLTDEHGWQVLGRDMTITTVIGTATYDLPEDFSGFESDSSWNRTSTRPMLGSIQEYEWQALKARQLTGTTFTMLFRVDGDQVELYDTPTAEETLVLPYRSRGWVETAGGTPKDNLELDDDVILFDPQLFKSGLKLAWMGAKGFDVTKQMLEYRAMLSAAIAKDSPRRTLSLNRAPEFPYLGALNIPDTNYGS
jgi:hypothetical protein